MSAKKTPGPWAIGHSETEEIAIREPDGQCVAVCCEILDGEMQANAEFIVRAVNAHAELLATLTGIRNAMRLAMPHLPADSVAIHFGEWLDEANEVIWKVTDTYPLPEGIARARQA